MRKQIAFIVAVSVVSFSTSVLARDDVLRFPVSDPMNTITASQFSRVKFYFGTQKYPPGAKKIGTYTSKRTTNAVGKSDKEACDWAFLSAIKSLYERTRQAGGNAVVNIRSVTTGWEEESEKEYVCRAGNVIAKVYLEGTVVNLPQFE